MCSRQVSFGSFCGKAELRITQPPAKLSPADAIAKGRIIIANALPNLFLYIKTKASVAILHPKFVDNTQFIASKPADIFYSQPALFFPTCYLQHSRRRFPICVFPISCFQEVAQFSIYYRNIILQGISDAGFWPCF